MGTRSTACEFMVAAGAWKVVMDIDGTRMSASAFERVSIVGTGRGISVSRESAYVSRMAEAMHRTRRVASVSVAVVSMNWEGYARAIM